MKQTIKIDVVSDVVCPWCYIGKRRLEQAMKTLENIYDFQLEYHPFELNPNQPLAGADQKAYLTDKFGGEERYHSLTEHVTAIAAREGLVFDYERQQVAPNTRKAHALLQLAKAEGVQLQLVELLFEAYFTNGLNLADDQNLMDVAELAGINRQQAERHLSDENSLLQVALEEQHLYKLGISGVPFFIVNQKYGISGAQTPDVFIKAFQEISSEKASVTPQP